MRRGFTIVGSTKHNLNTQSSAGTEIVAVDDCMNVILWNIYWLDAQGYDVLITFYIKTVKLIFFWKIMARFQTTSARSTLTSDIIS